MEHQGDRVTYTTCTARGAGHPGPTLHWVQVQAHPPLPPARHGEEVRGEPLQCAEAALYHLVPRVRCVVMQPAIKLMRKEIPQPEEVGNYICDIFLV